MSTPSGDPQARRPAEERAEEMMERVAGDASRWLGRFAGRVREEFEDLLAEARSLNDNRDRQE